MQSFALRIGRSWRWDPDVLLRLLEEGVGGSERALRTVRDTLEVLVGGRNIAADASEDALFPVLYDLLVALGDLHRGSRRKAIIPFRSEPWELVVERRADQALLSFYGAGGTRIVAARDATVAFADLVRSVAGAASTLVEELESLCPAWGSDPYLRAFRDAASTLLSSPPRPLGDLATAPSTGLPPTDLHRARAPRVARSLWIALSADLGDHGLRTYDGEHAYDLHSLLCSGDVRFETPQTVRVLRSGFPFLAAESLVAATEVALGAIDGEPGRNTVPLGDGRRSLRLTVDVAARSVRIDGDDDWGRTLTCSVEDFAEAALSAAQDVADSVLERNPAHRGNRRLTDLLSEIHDLRGWLDDLAPTLDEPAASHRPSPSRRAVAPRADLTSTVSVYRATLHPAWTLKAAGLEPRSLARFGPMLTCIVSGRLQMLDERSGAITGGLAEDEAPVVSVASAAGRLLVGRQDGELLCLKPGAGVQWAAGLEGPGAAASLAVLPDGDRIVIGAADGAVRCFGAEDGRRHWRFVARRASGFQLGMDDHHVYAAADDRSLYALDTESGRLTWRVRSGGGFTVAPVPLPTGALLALTGDGVVPEGRAMALDPTSGRTLWERRVGEACRRPAVLDGEGLLLCTRSGDEDSLVRLDMASGEELWRRSWSCLGIDDPSRPVLVDGLVCVKDDRGGLRAFDAATGAPVWTTDLAVDGRIEAVQNLDPIAGRSLIYVVTDRLVVVSAETGEELSQARDRLHGTTKLIRLGPRSLVLADGDRIEAWDLGTYLGLLNSSGA